VCTNFVARLVRSLASSANLSLQPPMNAPLYSPVKRNDRQDVLRKDREIFTSLESATEDRLREARAGNLRVKQTEKVQITGLDPDTAQRVMRGRGAMAIYYPSCSNLYFTFASQQKTFALSLPFSKRAISGVVSHCSPRTKVCPPLGSVEEEHDSQNSSSRRILLHTRRNH